MTSDPAPEDGAEHDRAGHPGAGEQPGAGERHDALDQEETAALATTMLAEVAQEIVHANDKAAVLIRALGIAYTILVGGLFVGDRSIQTSGWLSMVLWPVGIAAAIISVVAAGMALWPRLSKPHQAGAVTYWGQLHGYTDPAQVAAAIAESGLRQPERTYQQLMVLATVAQRKYQYIRASMLCAAVAALCVALAALTG